MVTFIKIIKKKSTKTIVHLEIFIENNLKVLPKCNYLVTNCRYNKPVFCHQNMTNTTGATCGTGSEYPSESPDISTSL